ncbi:LysR substrate-binding domain-containing protein [Pseudooceanicola sp.]|uniref:LysR substrate-binding domain-containing protein n=1 Tax=Pseudooceanicola sp. TaxID=1914328 RepID=UPI00260AC134|nr:LysR substrate-binding domain-containing protein [Pseudooceanicola sp.]MDF1855039.1 LysR substrate-binding domain-containing protein [Pseudooceanicola sp.]
MDQRYKNLPLNPLRAFAVASRQRTFTAAAQEMGVSQVAISRQISILERYLGMQLFERGARSVRLTEAGRAFGQEVAGLFDQIEMATRRVLSNERENTINLRIYPTFAHHWLFPRLRLFMQDFPDYRIRLDTSVLPLDFRGTHLDVALQLGHGAWKDAKARKLFEEVVDVVCSPDYLERHGPINTVSDLEGADLLHSKYRRREWELWAEAAGAEINALEGMEFDTSLLTYSATRRGFGLAVGQLDLLESELAAGELVRPLKKPHVTGAAFYAIWPTMTSVSTKTRHFIDWLLVQSGEAPEFFRQSRRVKAGQAT